MLSLCCQFMEQKTSKNGKVTYVNICNEKHLQYGLYKLGSYSDDKIHDTWVNNCTELLKVLKKIHGIGFRSMRISSGLLPLFDECETKLKADKEVLDLLKDIGDFVSSNEIRLTSHPDQYCLLSSNTPQVVDNSIKIFEHHSWVFDTMGLDASPFYAINIHGGVKNNKELLISNIKRLSANAMARLTLENDESSYSVKDLYDVYLATKTPVVFDSHHHTFNDAGLTIQEGLELAMTTWGKVKPLTHLSNTTPGQETGGFKERRKHSDYVHYIPECQRLANNNNLIDIDMEFKMKNLAILKAVQDFDIKL